MSCDLVIAVYNQLEYTKGCIESIKANTSCDHRIIVVDDASGEDTRKYLQGLSDSGEIVYLRNQANLGWVKSVNRGLGFSQAEFVCVMNNDIVVYPGWLEEMIAVSGKDDKIGIVNPLWELPKRFRGTRDSYFRNVVLKQKGRFTETDWARGFCFLIKRRLLDKVPGLDEDYSPGYYDDWDYSLRAMQRGFIVVRARGAFVWHFKNVTYEEVLSKEGLDRELSRKKTVFYGRWGKFDKILLVIDPSLKQKLNALSRAMLNLLRRQSRVVAIRGDVEFPLEHTNCFVKKVPGYLLKTAVVLHLLRNSSGSEDKLYDYVVCSGELSGFLGKFKFIRKKFVLKNIAHLLDEVK